MYNCKYCSDILDLYEFLKESNKNGYELVSVTQSNGYTVIYKVNKEE